MKSQKSLRTYSRFSQISFFSKIFIAQIYLLIAVAVLILPTNPVHAKMALNAEAHLFKLSRGGDYEKAKGLIFSTHFEEVELGRAVFESIKYDNSFSKEQEDYLHFLISEGADLGYYDSTADNALFLAIKQGNPAIVKLLMINGVDSTTIGSDGKDAMGYALSLHGEHSEIGKLFTAPVMMKAPPKIDNVKLSLNAGMLYISYDLVAGSSACVALEGSLDGGENYNMTFKHSNGDIGKNVRPGRNKQIVWKISGDYPKGLMDADVVLDVVAVNCG